MFGNKEVPFGDRTARRLMSVADDDRISNRTHGSDLPPCGDRPHVSDRQIAKGLGVSDKTVGTVRKDLEATAEIPQLKTNLGADGKERPRQVSRPTPEPTRHIALFSAAASDKEAGRAARPFVCYTLWDRLEQRGGQGGTWRY